MGVIQYCLVFFFFFLLVGCNKQEVNVLKENSLENERSMVKAKSLVIIVPGYELVQSRYPTFFVDFTSQFLGVDKNDNWPTDLAKYVKSHSNYDVEVFNWKPGLTKRFSFRPAAEDLAELLKKKKDYRDVTIFSKSVGGIVSQLALEELDGQKNIKRLIYVATPQGSTNPKLPENIEVINVFSRDDTMARRANFLLHLSRVYELEERVNLELPGLTHSEFNYNLEVTYEGKKVKLYDL
ncbi:hypothetical protein HYX12_05035, partial [Candidatus Woesearchaeota archaeon]|nr:hypothetical protein [Candidatus Woesearchaeota archaeon]